MLIPYFVGVLWRTFIYSTHVRRIAVLQKLTQVTDYSVYMYILFQDI